jgi:hypothetical protein
MFKKEVRRGIFYPRREESIGGCENYRNTKDVTVGTGLIWLMFCSQERLRSIGLFMYKYQGLSVDTLSLNNIQFNVSCKL